MNKPDIVLKALKRGRKVSAMTIIDMAKVTNPADIIYKLRKRGHIIITTEKHKAGRRWAEYSLEVAV